MPDGRLLLGGSSVVIRLGESGVPDPTFGNGAFGAPAMGPFRSRSCIGRFGSRVTDA